MDKVEPGRLETLASGTNEARTIPRHWVEWRQRRLGRAGWLPAGRAGCISHGHRMNYNNKAHGK